VRHTRPYFELDLTRRGAHSVGHAHRVIAQYLVAADLNERRREARRIAVERRHVRCPWIGAGEIIADEERRVVGAEHRVGRGVQPQ